LQTFIDHASRHAYRKQNSVTMATQKKSE